MCSALIPDRLGAESAEELWSWDVLQDGGTETALAKATKQSQAPPQLSGCQSAEQSTVFRRNHSKYIPGL